MKRSQPGGPSAPARRRCVLLSILFLWLLLAGLVSPPLHGSIPRDRHPTVELPALIEEPPAAELVASVFPPARLELGLSEGDAAILRRVLVRQNPWSAFDPEGLSLLSDAKDYVCGGLIGFGEVVTGNYAGPTGSSAEAHGRQGGRNLGVGVGLLLTVDGLQKFGTGLGAMAIAGAGEAVTAGGATLPAAAVGAGGATIAAVGAVEIVGGLIMVNHASGLPSIDQAAGNSSGGGNGPEGKTPRQTIEENKEIGAKHGEKVGEKVKAEQTDVKPELTLETDSGTRTRIDFAGKKAGEPKLTEAKGSETAPLTKNQKKAFPEIERKGATVRGENGGKAFPPGTKIPPTKVKIVRPKDL